MATESTIEKLARMTGETTDQVTGLLGGFHANGRLKKVLEASIHLKIEEIRQSLETCAADQLQTKQGVVRGLRNGLAALQVGTEKAT